jgi:hypothetical protein
VNPEDPFDRGTRSIRDNFTGSEAFASDPASVFPACSPVIVSIVAARIGTAAGSC